MTGNIQSNYTCTQIGISSTPPAIFDAASTPSTEKKRVLSPLFDGDSHRGVDTDLLARFHEMKIEHLKGPHKNLCFIPSPHGTSFSIVGHPSSPHREGLEIPNATGICNPDHQKTEIQLSIPSKEIQLLVSKERLKASAFFHNILSGNWDEYTISCEKNPQEIVLNIIASDPIMKSMKKESIEFFLNYIDAQFLPLDLAFDTLCDISVLSNYFDCALLHDACDHRLSSLAQGREFACIEEALSFAQEYFLTRFGQTLLHQEIMNTREQELPKWITIWTQENGILTTYGGLLTELSSPICKRLSAQMISRIIERVPNLKRIDLTRTKHSLREIQFNKNLEELTLAWCSHITASDLQEVLDKCPHLRKLNLQGARCDLTGVQLGQALEELILSYNISINDATFRAAIRRCIYLKRLDLSYTHCSLEGVQLGEALEELILVHCQYIRSSALQAAIEKCLRLRKLDLSKTQCTLKGVRFGEALEELLLSCSVHIEDADLTAAIRKCSKLNKLDVSWTPCILRWDSTQKNLVKR